MGFYYEIGVGDVFDDLPEVAVNNDVCDLEPGESVIEKGEDLSVLELVFVVAREKALLPEFVDREYFQGFLSFIDGLPFIGCQIQYRKMRNYRSLIVQALREEEIAHSPKEEVLPHSFPGLPKQPVWIPVFRGFAGLNPHQVVLIGNC